MSLSEKMFGSQRAITIWVVSIVFAIIFPAYFSVMANSADAAGGSASGAKARWEVNFIQDNLTSDETMSLGDGEQGDYYFDLESDMMIGYVEITVSCNDNDEPGPGPGMDSVDVETDFSGVSGTPDDESESGSCNGVAAEFTIQITPGFNGDGYIADGVTKSEIEAQWNDNGSGRGEWLTSVTMEVNTLGPSLVGGVIDSDEDVTVSWRAVLYTLEITAVAEEL